MSEKVIHCGECGLPVVVASSVVIAGKYERSAQCTCGALTKVTRTVAAGREVALRSIDPGEGRDGRL